MMHLVLINCSPRVVSASNTNLILQAFARGYLQPGNTLELYHLSQTETWSDIRAAFYAHENILMAVPLYVEAVPGLMMEFLETLSPKAEGGGRARTRLSFLLQGGFAEASQLRCGAQYLKALPAHLNCDYNGALLRGNMFALHMMPPASREKMAAPFVEMGRLFAQEQTFLTSAAEEFAGREYFSKSYIAAATLLSPVQRLFFHLFFKRMGCQGRLTARPYESLME